MSQGEGLMKKRKIHPLEQERGLLCNLGFNWDLGTMSNSHRLKRAQVGVSGRCKKLLCAADQLQHGAQDHD